jgi:hypothetical protein
MTARTAELGRRHLVNLVDTTGSSKINEGKSTCTQPVPDLYRSTDIMYSYTFTLPVCSPLVLFLGFNPRRTRASYISAEVPDSLHWPA